nr:hypothetical protein [Tanacetum cinerariifolium]
MRVQIQMMKEIESHGLDDEGHGLDDDGQGLEDEGTGMEEEDVTPEGQQQAFLVVDTAASEPLGLGYEAAKRRALESTEETAPSTYEVGQSSRVYTDILTYVPPAAPVQTPPSPEWLFGSLPVSPSSIVVFSPIALPVATPESSILVDEDQFLERLFGSLCRDYLCVVRRLSVRLSSSVEVNSPGRFLGAYNLRVATPRAVVHAGDKTSKDARSWYMIREDSKSWVFDEDEVESPPEIERKIVEPNVDKVEVDIPKQNDKPARRCKYHQRERMVIGTNHSRVNHTANTVPKAVLTRTGLKPINTVRTVNPKSTRRLNLAVLNDVSANKGKAGHSYKQLEDQGDFNSGCFRHTTGNISYLTDFKEFDRGYVTFGEVTGKGIIRNGYFVKEIKFNLFSVSYICDKKNSVLFTDTGCFVLSPGKSSIKTGPSQDYILMPLWNDGSLFDSSSKDSNGDNKDNDDSCKESKIDNQDRPNAENSTNDVNTVGPSINTASSNINTASLTVNTVR